jgi:oligosaccharide repeat unit polymerase
MMMILASFQFYDIYAISDETYMLSVLSVCSFIVGYHLRKIIRFTSDENDQIKSRPSEINIKRYYILLVTCLVSVWQNYVLIGVVYSQGLNIGAAYQLMARAVTGQAEELADIYTDIGSQVQQYIGYPLLYLLIPISILLYYKTLKKRYVLIVLLLFLIRFLADFKRTILVFIILFFAFYAVLLRKKIMVMARENPLVKRKLKYLSVALSALLLLTFVIISAFRSDEVGESYSVFQNFYYYYIGCFKLLDIRVEEWDLLNIDHTLGFTTFRGVIAPFFAGLKLLTGVDASGVFADATYLVNSLHNYVVYISSGHLYNTYTTNIFQFYCDGGLLGVCVLSMIYGWISSAYYKKYREIGDVRSIFNFGYFFCIFILFTNMHINSIVICYVWPLILERFIFKKISDVNMKNK